MHYQGSKYKLRKQILATIESVAPETEIVIEPFMGGGNMTARIAKWRPIVCGDAFPGLADMHIAVQNGFRLPDCVSESEWRCAKDRAERGDRSPYVIAVGFAISFAGAFFRGYARGSDPKKAAFAKFFNSSADKFAAVPNIHIQPGATDFRAWTPAMGKGVSVYCDPPYFGTVGYPGSPPWDTALFYDTVCSWKNRGARVFISELNCPFKKIAEYQTGCVSTQSVHAINRNFADRLYEVG